MRETRKLILLSLTVGICTGLAAVVLLQGIRLVQGLVSHFIDIRQGFNWPVLLFPGLGMLLSLLIVKYLIRDNIGHGVTKVLQAISSNESNIKPHNTFSSVITSALTIGLGGSVGAEAPIVYTGAAIGSNIGRLAGLKFADVTILVGCGAAGAIAGIFKAPLAGVLFTLEILLFNISIKRLMPLLVATVSSTVVAYLFQGTGPSFACTLEPLAMHNIPFYIILGAFAGLISVYYTRTTLWLEDRFSRISSSFLRWGICAGALGLLLILFPPLFGEGYSSVSLLLNGTVSGYEDSPLSFLGNGWGIPLFFALVMVFKVVAMTLTNAGGGVGGTFGPTLVVGAFLGFVLSRSFNLISGLLPWDLPEQNFVLVGMAALMAGVMQAPMTSIFLIAEITGGYELLLPLITASTVSFCTTRIWERYSIYTKRLAQSGELLTHDSDQIAITLMHTSDLIRDKYPRLAPEERLGDILGIVSESTAAVFPVVDSEGRFQGMVDMDEIRKHMFNKKEYKTLHVYNMMRQPEYTVKPDEPMQSVVGKFEKSDEWRIPALDENNIYLGFVSKSRILMAYREELKSLSTEE